jgi:hypothetical protein
MRMSVDSISSASGQQQQFQQIRSDYQSLSQALSNGNLSAAQKAYDSITQDQQNGPQPPANSPIATAFANLGQALQSGDLSGAQQAFSSLQSDFQSLRQAHGAHRGGGGAKGAGGGDDGDSADASSSTDNSSKTIANEVTTTNANGTITITTTYTDGTTSSETEPNPTPVTAKSALDGSNSAQMSVLLNAQETAA